MLQNCNEEEKVLKKIIIFLISLTTISIGILSGCTQQNLPNNGDVRISNTEFIGGKYDASIVYLQFYCNGVWSNNTEIKYIKNGIEHQGAYWSSMKVSLDWIKKNTNENCTILCWWDYAMMIEGYAERNVVTRFASLALKDSIAAFGCLDEDGEKKYIEEHEWSLSETIQELAMVLTTTNISSDAIKEIIEKYNISYIFTNSYDKSHARIIFNAAGKNADEYLIDETPNEQGNESLIFKMWDVDPQIYGLQLYYSSNPTDAYSDVRVFKVV